jgi:hypothetical protein
MNSIVCVNQVGTFTSHQYGSGGWSPWRNRDFPIASFYRDAWRVHFYIVYDTIEDELDSAPPRCEFSVIFDHGRDAHDPHAPPPPSEEQIAAALWVKENAALFETSCQAVLNSIITQTVSARLEREIDPAQTVCLARKLEERGYGTPQTAFLMTHPCALKLLLPLPDGRVIFCIQFDWACDDEHGPVLYFDKERLITHNHLSEDEWKDALAAEGLPGYRSPTKGRG